MQKNRKNKQQRKSEAKRGWKRHLRNVAAKKQKSVRKLRTKKQKDLEKYKFNQHMNRLVGKMSA